MLGFVIIVQEVSIQMDLFDMDCFKNYASWIPALSRIEGSYHRYWKTKQEAVSAFMFYYGLCDKALLCVYDCGKTFSDLNLGSFVDTYGNRDEVRAHCFQAEKFLGL